MLQSNITSSVLTFPYSEAPQLGSPLQIAPGLYWLRFGLPFQLDHINLWLLDDDDSYTVVDSGIYSEHSIDLWTQIAKQLDKPIQRVFCTHAHPDHIGMAGWMYRNWQTHLLISYSEFMLSQFLSGRLHEEKHYKAHFVKHGLPLKDEKYSMEMLEECHLFYPNFVPYLPPEFERVVEHQTLTIGKRRWRTLLGRGHTAEHLALYCDAENIMIAGDMVLPRITPVVGVWPFEPFTNPLALFEQSLQSYLELDHNTLVLPSHGLVYQGLHTRIDQLIKHHEERLQMILSALEYEKSAYDLIPLLFKRELDSHQLSFAMSEAIAHLHALLAEEKVVRVTKGDGVLRFRRR